MKAKSDDMVDALEQAILTRAKSLADELATKARHRRDIILREANDRLSLADERENASARAEAERAQRRQVQASELKLQARLDRLRWELVHAVQGRLAERMAELRADRDAYLGWLESMVREADRLLPDGDIHAEVNAEDHAWLAERWQALVDRAAPGRHVVLLPEPTWGSGGVRLRSVDGSAQLDNRFEGRLSRLEAGIQRVILERLFPGEPQGGVN
jgi:V/A-type H+-transporting ATPase subunit E